MITKPTFVGPDFTRRPVKYERFIRPMGLRYKKANVTVSGRLLPNYHDYPLLMVDSASGIGRNSAVTYNKRQEKSAESHVYAVRRIDQGYNYRGERERVGLGHSRWQSSLGEMGANHE